VDDYEPARQILELVLAEDPEHRDATVLMGDIAVHEGDWERALHWTERALVLAPDDLGAHEDRVHALAGAKRWAEAARAAGRGLGVQAPDDDGHARLRLERTRCLIELGDFAGAAADLDIVAAVKNRRSAAVARALRAESLLRQEVWRMARAEATDAPAAGPPTMPAAILTAAAWESAARLGEAGAAPVPTEQHVQVLRWNGRDAWVDRLLELGMEPVSSRPTGRQAALRRWQVGHLTRL
jgi:tetratricopeptide (TPR) repeat protein